MDNQNTNPQPEQPTQPTEKSAAEMPKKSRKVLWVIVAVAAVVVLAGAGFTAFTVVRTIQQQQKDFQTGNRIDALATYTDKKSGISIKIPENWDVKRSTPSQKSIVRLSITPPAGSFSNAFDQGQGIDLLCESTSGKVTKDSFTQAIKKNVIPSQQASGLTISDQSAKTINQIPAYLYNATSKTGELQTAYYHGYYMLNSRAICDIYVLVIRADTDKLPVETYANDIVRSFSYKK